MRAGGILRGRLYGGIVYVLSDTRITGAHSAYFKVGTASVESKRDKGLL